MGFCSGNSGDPIFAEDFGTGTTNNALPTGTTTYAYIAGFPNDGLYTVSNGTFGNGFDWHQTQDHTIGDVNGKCLIVNAGFSAGEFYRTTVLGLCESTTYEFSAWLINLVIVGSFCSTQPGGTIPINVSFEIWDGTDTNLLASGNTGNIVETSSPNWQEYGLVFQTLAGQNTVILKMINNGQGGCGNDLAIDDIEFKSCGDTIIVEDASNNNSVSLCSVDTPYNTTVTAIPDNAVFSNHFYQWQESTDGINWTDVVGATNQNIVISGVTTSTFYRTKVSEFAANLNNVDCITYSDIYEIDITQAPIIPTIECWETATFNNSTCSWDITGSQPTMPTGLECWETATFNYTTCVWDVAGTQPIQPTIDCWETATFNDTTCAWDITGTQPTMPTGLECWETATFNDATCSWDVTGTQPVQPTLECWETATFNNTTCVWDVTGTQPAQPTIECWETATFNDTTCAWDVTGTQPTAPTGLDCWETATFNNTTCVWNVTGTQPAQPTIECWETATFNDTTCAWDVTGVEPLDYIDEHLTLCEGEDLVMHANTNFVNPSFLWDTGETTEFKTVSASGTYVVEIFDNICSTTIKTIYVELIEIPIIDTVISDGSNIVITTTNSGDFEYSLNGTDFQSSNTFINIDGGLYTVYVKGENCDEIVIMQHLHFYIPKFFTPNDDGKNDTFNLKGLEHFGSSQVYIFDRYGKLLKSSRKNAPFSWNGTFNNKLLPTNDYWYIITIEGQKFAGHFTLKR